MTTSQNANPKRYGILVLVLVLIFAGGVRIWIGQRNYAIRVLGIVLIVSSIYLFRRSGASSRRGYAVPAENVLEFQGRSGPGRLLIGLSWTLVPVLIVSLLLLQFDASAGGHSVWPVDLFAIVGLACAIVWGLLVAKILARSNT